jgi:hypothetical protein
MNKSSYLQEYVSGTKHIIIALLCILLVSCASSHTQSLKVTPERHSAAITDQAYGDAGHDIVSALISGNADAFSNTIDKQALLDRTFEGTYRESSAIRKARKSLDDVLTKTGTLMTRNFGENTRLTFVRSRYMNREHRALMRINMEGGGLSYLDFILAKDDKGAVKIIDWHDYAQGQLYSDSLRQALVLMLPQRELPIGKLLGKPAIDRKAIEQFSELAKLSNEQKYEEWLTKYKELPDNLKYSRIVLVTRVLITSALGYMDEYRYALNDVNYFIGDDPALSLMLIDHHMLERNYKAAYRALDRLSRYTGGDAAIDFLRANVSLAEKNYHQSTRYAETAIKEDSNFEDPYWTLLVASIYSKQYGVAVDTLNRLEHNFGYLFEPNEIARMAGYEEFADSSIFEDWKDGRIPTVDR